MSKPASDLPLQQVASRLGATPHVDGSCSFRLWAPAAKQVELGLPTGDDQPAAPIRLPMQRVHAPGEPGDGHWELRVPDLGPGRRYGFHLDGGELLPDPCSRRQTDGVHAASMVQDLEFAWTDGGWHGVPLEELVVYELHVGTFTEAGTFDALHEHLPRLRELGVTALELMPVASFPGPRNWGYDGVLPFAVQESYGGPAGLQRLVDAAHAHGLGVLLDVVYNHLGPEGNRLREFGPYFTDRFATPWGDALNFDGPHSDGVRRYFVDNALQWIQDFHCDGLRLDAIHAIHDQSALPFLEALTTAVQERGAQLGRPALVIGETDQNDPRYVTPREAGGCGMDAIWCDDLHHALHVATTAETSGYYKDFEDLELLAEAWTTGMAFRGRWSPFRHRRHGRDDESLDPRRIVTCTQNHDQIGNRLLGDRLTTLAGQAQQRLATLALLTSPVTPLLFMGEEQASERPFQYFTSHGDTGLVAAVREGRKREFAAFGWQTEAPDPQAEETYRACILEDQPLDPQRPGWLRDLLALRPHLPTGRGHCLAHAGRSLALARGADALVILHFAPEPGQIDCPLPAGSRWRLAAATGQDWPTEFAAGAGSVTFTPGPWHGACYLRT